MRGKWDLLLSRQPNHDPFWRGIISKRSVQFYRTILFIFIMVQPIGFLLSCSEL